jgi:hypothetical protein
VKLIQNNRKTSNNNIQQGRKNYEQENSTNKKEEESGVFEEKGKVRFGKQGNSKPYDPWFPNLSALSTIPVIGIWGIVKNKAKSLKEIAALVYGDANLWEFIYRANKMSSDNASAGQKLVLR